MQDKVLIFGAGPLQISLIRVARSLGYYTVVIDPDVEAEGASTADEFHVLRGDDLNGTIEIILTRGIRSILTAATDKPILMMSRLSDLMQLNFPSYRSTSVVLNKLKFKDVLNQLGIAHARGHVLKSLDGFCDSSLDFPVIIKPVQNSGSRGVVKCANFFELENCFDETLYYCDSEGLLIEEYIEGDEISVEAIVQDGKVNIIQITDKIVSSPPYNVEIGHLQPSKYSIHEVILHEILQKIVTSVGLDNCALHPEFKFNENGFTIIEMGPRLGGDFITSHLVPLSTGINIEECLINVSLGARMNYTRLQNASLISFLDFPTFAKIKRIVPESELISKFGQVHIFRTSLLIGQEIPTVRNSFDRYGYFILSGDSRESLETISDSIHNYLRNEMLY